MFSFDELLNSLLGSYSLVPVTKPVPAKRTYLPELEISAELQLQFDKSYLDFITKLYLTADNKIPITSQEWFIQEIAYYLKLCYPNLQLREYELILQQIIDSSKIKKENK